MGFLARSIVPVPVSLAITPLRALPEPSEIQTPLVPVPVSPRSRETARKAGERAPSAAEEDRLIAQVSVAHAVSAEAEAAYADLNHALLLANEQGQEVPCLGIGSEMWTSEDPDDQTLAADRCYDCPALLLCGEYAGLAREEAGVWGGKVARARKPRVYITGKATKRSSPGPCTCGCGGTTRGGWYLSGHDSRHLSALLAAVRRRELPVSEAVEALSSTPALQAKLRKAL